MHFQDLTDRDHLPHHLIASGLLGEGVEIGVFEGDYSDLLRTLWPGKMLYGIDPYLNFPDDVYRDGCNRADLSEIRNKAWNRLASRVRYKFIFEESVKASEQFTDSQLDFAYIDGNHRYESVKKADLEAWWPKVKSGGIVGLHDFYTRDNDSHLCNVPRAVWEFCYEKKLSWMVTPCTSAWIRKP